MSTPRGPRDLEQLVSGLLQGQPLRRAPQTLSARVLAQVGTVHWWQRSYRHWPLAIQVAFLALCCGFVWLTFSAAGSVEVQPGEWTRSAGPLVTWLHTGAELLAVAESTRTSVLDVVPGYWWYVASAVGIALYLVLFGLGTVVYRTLYRDR